jgi:hypothetical protein
MEIKLHSLYAMHYKVLSRQFHGTAASIPRKFPTGQGAGVIKTGIMAKRKNTYPRKKQPVSY